MAHSLGCWVATLFAKRYPDNIKQFMFLSPACMAKPKPDFCPRAFIDKYESWGKRQLFRLALMSWGKHYSPSIVFKFPGKTWAWFLHRQWATRIRCAVQAKKETLSKIIMQVCMRHSTADRCIDMAIEFGGDARISIQDLFRENEQLRNIPTTFAYGDEDFMKPEHAFLLIDE